MVESPNPRLSFPMAWFLQEEESGVTQNQSQRMERAPIHCLRGNCTGTQIHPTSRRRDPTPSRASRQYNGPATCVQGSVRGRRTAGSKERSNKAEFLVIESGDPTDPALLKF